jgi:colanic acid/amylovoran biosynthesis glycosyltransferase
MKGDHSKILLVTSICEDGIVGPANFVRLITNDFKGKIDILTENKTESIGLFSQNIKFNILTSFFSMIYRSYQYYIYVKKHKFHQHYEKLIFISPVLAFFPILLLKNRHKYIVMLNDENNLQKGGDPRLDFFRRKIYQLIEKYTLLKAEKTWTVSVYLKNQMIKKHKINPKKISVIYRAINVSEYPFHHQWKTNHNTIKILFIKNDYDRGGLKILFTALCNISDFLFELDIIGLSQKDQLKCADILKNQKNVRITYSGIQSKKQIIAKFHTNNILCIPSKSEALGFTNIEGLASGISLVTTNVGGIPEVTNNGHHIFECLPNDEKDLSRAIMDCLKSPDYLRFKKAKEGREWVENNFDKSIINLLIKQELSI